MNYESLTKEEIIRQLQELQHENNLLKATYNQEINNLRKLSEAVEQSPVSIVITNLDGNIEYANSKTSDTTGYSLEELMGQNPRVLKSGETSSDEYHQLWDSITRAQAWKGVFHNKRKNGELYWEFARIAPILGPDVETEILLHGIEKKRCQVEKNQTPFIV